ncbi:hypothetical protein NGM37_59855, partial [Streptomyces sp. TRM76130]|nr:hypothetical protein [Streptomyces sp. TRM76130]
PPPRGWAGQRFAHAFRGSPSALPPVDTPHSAAGLEFNRPVRFDDRPGAPAPSHVPVTARVTVQLTGR